MEDHNAKLREVFNLQDELNKSLNSDWITRRTEREFVRAIWLECAEAVDCLPWKWWKQMETNYDNLAIELVDIFHFWLSLVIVDSGGVESALHSDAVREFLEGFAGSALSKHNPDEVVIGIEEVAREFLNEDYVEGSHKFGVLVRAFFSFDELHLLYTGKNILNRIRQEEGYRDGSYQKILGGKEDNHYLLDLVQAGLGRAELEVKIREAFQQLRRQSVPQRIDSGDEQAGPESVPGVHVAEKLD